jgi:hypothetical protein
LIACFVAVLVTWMSFVSVTRESRRAILSMLETHIVMSSLIFLPRSYSRASPHTSSRALSHFSHAPNHRSCGFGSRENSFVPKCFGYAPHPYRGDRFPRRPNFLVGGCHTHPALRQWMVHVFPIVVLVPLGQVVKC